MRLTRLFGRRPGDDGDDGAFRGADPTTRALYRAGLPGADGWTVQIVAEFKEHQLDRLAEFGLGDDWGARPPQDVGWRAFAERLAADRTAVKLVEQLFTMLVKTVPRTAADSAARLGRRLPAAADPGQNGPAAVTDDRPVLVSQDNTTAAVNTVWTAVQFSDGDSDTVAALGALLRRALTEPWSVDSARLRNACINALAEVATEEAVEQLSALAPLAPAKAQRSQILLAVQLATRTGDRAPSKLAELGVARHGLGDDWRLAVSVHHRSYSLEFEPSGRVSVSGFADAEPEDEHALRVVNKYVRDIEETYAHEVIRLEELLSAQRTWPYADWRHLYLAHPITRAVTCRLVWRLHLPDGRCIEMIPDYVGGLRAMDGRLTGGKRTVSTVAADVASILQDATMVELWHPRAATDQSIARWRSLIAGLRPGQPFPQIAREYTRRLPAPDDTEVTDYAARNVPVDEFEAAAAALRWKFVSARGVSDTIPVAAEPVVGLSGADHGHVRGRERERHRGGSRSGRNHGGSAGGSSGGSNSGDGSGGSGSSGVIGNSGGGTKGGGTSLCFHEYPDAGLACVLRISRPEPDTVLTGPAWFARIGDKNREPVPLGAPGDLVFSEALRALARLAGTRLPDGDILDAVPVQALEDTIADEPSTETEQVEDAVPDRDGATDWNRIL
jgi:hypothetical protein